MSQFLVEAFNRGAVGDSAWVSVVRTEVEQKNNRFHLTGALP